MSFSVKQSDGKGKKKKLSTFERGRIELFKNKKILRVIEQKRQMADPELSTLRSTDNISPEREMPSLLPSTNGVPTRSTRPPKSPG